MFVTSLMVTKSLLVEVIFYSLIVDIVQFSYHYSKYSAFSVKKIAQFELSYHDSQRRTI